MGHRCFACSQSSRLKFSPNLSSDAPYERGEREKEERREKREIAMIVLVSSITSIKTLVKYGDRKLLQKQ
jgi:hypothetical protein